MSTYIMSDIHGEYDKYISMLNKIEFNESDVLYILGDVIDRGLSGIQILQDCMKRKNVRFLLGNHELMMLEALDDLKKIKDGELNLPTKVNDYTPQITRWIIRNGGLVTFDSFLELSLEEQNEIIDYLEHSYLIQYVQMNDVTYHLSHAYTTPLPIDSNLVIKDLPRDVIFDVVWTRIFDPAKKDLFTATLDSNVTYIIGHTYTQYMNHINEDGKGIIYKNQNYEDFKVIDVDCGCACQDETSQLGCLRLEDLAEFYV